MCLFTLSPCIIYPELDGSRLFIFPTISPLWPITEHSKMGDGRLSISHTPYLSLPMPGTLLKSHALSPPTYGPWWRNLYWIWCATDLDDAQRERWAREIIHYDWGRERNERIKRVIRSNKLLISKNEMRFQQFYRLICSLLVATISFRVRFIVKQSLHWEIFLFSYYSK